MAYGTINRGQARSRRRQTVQGGIVKSKKVVYSATQSDEVFSISELPSANAKSNMPSKVTVSNIGPVPLNVMVGYETYSSDTAVAGTEYLQVMLMPGESFLPPIRAVIATGADTAMVRGTAVDNATPSSDMYLDSGADVKNDTLSNTTDPVNFGVTVSASANSKPIRVGDLIRIENEVLEVLGTYEDDPTGSSLVEGDIRCARGKYGTTNASHSGTPDIRFPFFNAHHEFDKYSIARTDANGNFLSHNFFGLGRSSSGPSGITPGSIAIKFFTPGFQKLGLTGIGPSTSSGLTAGTTYYFKIAIDGSSAEEISFTVDSTNTDLGGLNGVLAKMQSAMNTKFITSSSNLFEKGADVQFINGDIVFTSRSHLSTSAIALTAGTSGAGASVRLFAQQNGRIPILASINDAIAAKLEDDFFYDHITYEQRPNTGIFAYDDGAGNISGACGGRINYETGRIELNGAPINAEFVYSCLHTSAFSGRLSESATSRANSIKSIFANTPSQKWNGAIRVKATP